MMNIFKNVQGGLHDTQKTAYEKARQLLTQKKYADAEQAFKLLGDYEDAGLLALYCKACAHCEAGQYEAARKIYRWLNKRRNGFLDSRQWFDYCDLRWKEDRLGTDVKSIRALADQYAAMGAFTDCADRAAALRDRIASILENRYNEAVALMNEGRYIDAHKAFVGMRGYKDCAYLADSMHRKIKLEECANAKVGDFVTFGRYDPVKHEYTKDIEWRVLDRQDNRLLLVRKEMQNYYDGWSKYIEYNLNDEFFRFAFSIEEKKMIEPVERPVHRGKKMKVFLLSLDEVKKYFSSEKDRICEGIYRTYSDGSVLWEPEVWWLEDEDRVVWWNGKIATWEYGSSCDPAPGVRPALWINLDLQS